MPLQLTPIGKTDARSSNKPLHDFLYTISKSQDEGTLWLFNTGKELKKFMASKYESKMSWTTQSQMSVDYIIPIMNKVVELVQENNKLVKDLDANIDSASEGLSVDQKIRHEIDILRLRLKNEQEKYLAVRDSFAVAKRDLEEALSAERAKSDSFADLVDSHKAALDSERQKVEMMNTNPKELIAIAAELQKQQETLAAVGKNVVTFNRHASEQLESLKDMEKNIENCGKLIGDLPSLMPTQVTAPSGEELPAGSHPPSREFPQDFVVLVKTGEGHEVPPLDSFKESPCFLGSNSRVK